MSALKRSASSRSVRITAHPSPYRSSVTLFEPERLAGPSSASPRRSKRVKLDGVPGSLVDLKDSDQVTSCSAEESANSSLITKLGRNHSKSPRKLKSIPQSLAIPHPVPERWQETYDAINEMRSNITAPVDTMGCDQAQLRESDPKSQRFSTLVSLMLSSQTKDEVTDAAVSKLRSAVGGSITVDALRLADEGIISDAIAKVGFWRRKTQYIKQTAQRLYEDFESDVPKTVDELCSLPGVGPKMAFLALQVAWNLNVGIGVDVHVHRITNRLGWHKPPTKNPEETRLNLQSWLPKELHPQINRMLVGFGQTICLPVNPRCDLCDLSSRNLCPSAAKDPNSKTRKASAPKVEIRVDEDVARISTDPPSELV